MAAKKQSYITLNGNQAEIALDLLGKIVEQRKRMAFYKAMERDGRRRDFTAPPGTVRFVDQERHKEVLDVPVQQLIDDARSKQTALNVELSRHCNIVVPLAEE